MTQASGCSARSFSTMNGMPPPLVKPLVARTPTRDESYFAGFDGGGSSGAAVSITPTASCPASSLMMIR